VLGGEEQRDVVGLIVRRRWLILLPLAAGIALTPLLARYAPPASGAVAGLVLGVLIVGLLEYRDSSFGRAEEVHEALSVPVLASIPVMNSDRQVQAARRRRRVMDVGGAAALVAAMIVLALWRP
jgi:hypothetical protein